jgi:hypothetical protein
MKGLIVHMVRMRNLYRGFYIKRQHRIPFGRSSNRWYVKIRMDLEV